MTIEEMVDIIAYDTELDYKFELFDLLDDKNYTQATKHIQNYFKCDEETAKNVCMEYKKEWYDDPTEEDLLALQEEYKNRVAQNKPKCPICNSTNLTKISGMTKAVKIGLFGIFGAGDIGKTWKCNNCGSKF